MKEIDISRRSLLRKGSAAGISAGVFSHNSLALSGDGGPDGLEQLGFEYLKGREKWTLVRKAIRTREFQNIYERLRELGWSLSHSAIDAFQVRRDIEYEGVLIGFEKPNTPDGTAAHFMHLEGELPEEMEHTSFGHIGRRPAQTAAASVDAPEVEETYIVPEGENEIATHTATVDASDDDVSTSGHGGDDSCTICYQSCRIGWRCALTILGAGLGAIGCTLTAVISGGLSLLICLAALGIDSLLAFDCVSNRDCDKWTRTTVTRSEFERKDPTDGETSFHNYCQQYSCN